MDSDISSFVKVQEKLIKLGKFDEVESRCYARISSRPADPEAYCLLGEVFRHKKQIQGSIENYKRSLELAPLAKTFIGLAKALQAAGKHSEARELLRQLQNNHDLSHDERLQIGEMFISLDDPENAKIGFQQILNTDPDNAAALLGLGVTLSRLNKDAEALSVVEKSATLDPDNAMVHDNLGIISMGLGLLDKSMQHFRKALQIDPDLVSSHYGLSRLKKYTYHDVQMQQMESLHAKKGKDHAKLCFALAKAYADMGGYSASFEMYKEGNRFHNDEINFSMDKEKKLFAGVKSIFANQKFSLGEYVIDEEFNPIFIVGMPRSGTTLVEQILASHSEVSGAGELPFIRKLCLERLSQSEGESIEQFLRRNYKARVRELGHENKFVCDKMPLNFIWTGFILLAFPGARIVHTSRDRIAVIWSLYKNYFLDPVIGFSFDLKNIQSFYDEYLNMMQFWEEVFPNRIYTLDYEQLTDTPESEISKLLTYCGLKWEDNCLNFHKLARPVKTLSDVQVRSPIYRGSSSDWMKYEKYLREVIAQSPRETRARDRSVSDKK